MNLFERIFIRKNTDCLNITITLRQEADAQLDALLGITRLQFNPAFSSNLGIDISRMAASSTRWLSASSGRFGRHAK